MQQANANHQSEWTVDLYAECIVTMTPLSPSICLSIAHQLLLCLPRLKHRPSSRHRQTPGK